MESKTTIQDMLKNCAGIIVPDYQRAYSWDTKTSPNNTNRKQVDTFYDDLVTYYESKKNKGNESSYYLGHFLFEETGNKRYAIIDGQQRLTTIEIFLSVIFQRLNEWGEIEEKYTQLYEDMVKRGSIYRFETVEYDKLFFRDFVINHIDTNTQNPDTQSKKRIIEAYTYFSNRIADKSREELLEFVDVIAASICTTHTVSSKSEAIQMFLFQNSRGKKPSKMEILKAQFMYYLHLYGGDEKDCLIDEIDSRFKSIYKSIAEVEDYIDEDSILNYTTKVFFNSLWEDDGFNKIQKMMDQDSVSGIRFIINFSNELAQCFYNLSIFFKKDEKEYIEAHALIALKWIDLSIPFVLKAFKYNISEEERVRLYDCFQKIVLRDRIIGTRGDLRRRLNEFYQSFDNNNKDISRIVERIDYLCNVDSSEWWNAYWNLQHLEEAVQGWINHDTAKYILWKYENYLITQEGEAGYKPIRFDRFISTDLEHIAPQTPSSNPVADGYAEYSKEFTEQYIDCIGNYLLLSGSHNRSLGNKSFKEKRATYNELKQQREIQEMTDSSNPVWGKEQIEERKKRLVSFIVENL